MARPFKIEPSHIEEAQQPSVVTLIKDLISETGELMRAEADVIKLEMQESTRAMLMDSVKAMIYGGVALLGMLSLMAFLIIGLGDLLTGGAYGVTGFWVSALIIGVLFTAVGGWLAYRNAKHIGQDIGLPKTRSELRTARRFVREETDKIREAGKP